MSEENGNHPDENKYGIDDGLEEVVQLEDQQRYDQQQSDHADPKEDEQEHFQGINSVAGEEVENAIGDIQDENAPELHAQHVDLYEPEPVIEESVPVAEDIQDPVEVAQVAAQEPGAADQEHPADLDIAVAQAPISIEVEEVDTTQPNHINSDYDQTQTGQTVAPFQNFTTPSKSLPPLKDIEKISTPKSFSVARDDDSIMESSPMHQHIPLHRLAEEPEQQQQQPDQQQGQHLVVDANNSVLGESSSPNIVHRELLNIPQSELSSLSASSLALLQSKIASYDDMLSEISLMKVNQEQMVQIQDKKSKLIQSKLQKLTEKNSKLQEEYDNLHSIIPGLQHSNDELTSTKSRYERRISELEEQVKAAEEENSKFSQSRDSELTKIYEQNDSLTKANLDMNTKLGQLSKELNDVRNEKFDIQLKLNKSSNELTYTKTQKEWFQKELKSVQERYTELIQKHETEYVITNNKLTRITAQVEGLTKNNESQKEQILQYQRDIESNVNKNIKLSNELDAQKRKFVTDLQSKQELLELTQVQSEERSNRVEQLESYVKTVKEKFTASIEQLESASDAKSQKIAILTEKLKRTEEVLDEELRKETELPKLSESAEKLAASSGGGMSLSALYTEFSHLKKQLVMERTQKEKLSYQLETFIEELEAKKPAISNYREQIKFYENSLNDSFNKIEAIRMEKLDVEKFSKTLSSRVNGLEGELVSMKMLCKDLGRQLCFYLIHSRVRDGDEEPLTVVERKAIENILAKSNANNGVGEEESDTDQLISERLVGFASIIDLQQKNQELLTVVRQLGKQLENKDEEFSKDIESVAIDEAKEAILTLQNELESVNLKLSSVEKERDVFKGMTESFGSHGSGVSQNGLLNGSKNGSVSFLQDSNNDLKAQLKNLEQTLNNVRTQSEAQIRDLNSKLRLSEEEKNSLSLKVNNLQHNVDLTETRLRNSETTFKNLQQELNRVKEDGEFWKQQTSKQETAFITSSNKLRSSESDVNKLTIELKNLHNERNIWKSLEKSLESDINQLKIDKNQLNEFVTNLQSLLKDRETSSKQFSDRLNQSIENYQKLQERLNEKEERIMILSSQSELSMKAQNTKLEQLHELSSLLVDTRVKLAERNGEVERLEQKIEELSTGRLSQVPVVNGATVGNSSEDDEKISLELDSLRKELRISEKQVDEFSSIAKSAEEALGNLTSAFEDYKVESERQRRDLLAEKTNLQNEISNLNESLKHAKDQILSQNDSHTKELDALRNESQGFKLKADAYDELQKDYEVKLTNIGNDLQVQIKLAGDFQTKFQSELKKNEELNEVIAKLKSDSANVDELINNLKSELDEVKTELSDKLNAIEEVKENSQAEIAKNASKLQDLQTQNQILLNQLQLQKNGSSEGVDADESEGSLRQVVNYLRHEKDSAEAKLGVKVEEQTRLELKLKHINLELESTKSDLRKALSSSNELSDLSKEHEKLLEQLQQLNILRESNTTLRNENNENIGKIQKLTVELEIVRKQLDPLQKQIVSLKTEGEVKDQSVKLISEEMERLKTRVSNNINNNNQKSDSISSTEFEALKNENETLKKSNNELGQTIKELKDKVESSELEVKNMKEENEKLDVRFNKLKVEAQDKLKRRAGEVKDLKDTIEQLKANLEKTEQSLIETQKTPTEGATNASSSAAVEELKSKFDEVEKEKSRLVKENNDLNLRLKKAEASTAEFNKLKEEYEAKLKSANDASKDNSEQSKRLEQEYQAKHDELYQTIKEKLEKENAEALKEHISKIEGSDAVREELKKQFEEESQKLKEEFAKDLEKTRTETRKLSEKTTELRVKMLNKKIAKLTEQVSGLKKNAPSSLPATPQAQQGNKSDATSVVNRPAIDRANTPVHQNQGKQSNQQQQQEKQTQQNTPNAQNAQKRPFGGNKSQVSNKRPKE
ncbi:putative nucleoporin Nup211p [[Candida] railenensis]|uniref:Nucleoporin Nup211p n=1 Tax=[Candida] railenensis TaxID=45579 RepID=A0A9P0W0J1_9ASCO|nr:putative nucleoporin Nup211p [[Candida] railenensis]